MSCAPVAPGWAQSIALTFDDGFDTRTQPSAAEWNARILRRLDDADVEAMLFPAAGRVDTEEGLRLVRDWGEAGHAVANHTYAHMNLNAQEVSVAAFIADLEKAEKLLKYTPGWTRKLRFPYLKEGDTVEKREEVRDWMRRRGYRPASPSIDASDWYYNSRFLDFKSECPQCDAAPLKQAYLDHLWDRAQYYDGLARRVLGRSPKYVLLLHTNAINAEYLADIVSMFESRGWSIVSARKAYRDPMYRNQPNVLPAGESIVWSLAKAQGATDLRYPAEDSVYEAHKLDHFGL